MRYCGHADSDHIDNPSARTLAMARPQTFQLPPMQHLSHHMAIDLSNGTDTRVVATLRCGNSSGIYCIFHYKTH